MSNQGPCRSYVYALCVVESNGNGAAFAADRERELQGAMRFAASGYYWFFMDVLDRDRDVDAALCARLSDACLEMLFERRT